jgi:hypothetical protein
VAIVPGDTIHIPDTGPAHERGKPHLFVVLTKPCINGMTLLVPMCRIRGKFDPACKLVPGEHAFVDEASYVAYYHINRFSMAVLEKQLAQGIIHANDPVNPALLKRICDGVETSRHCPPVEKTYYQEQLKAVAVKAAS